MTGFKCYNPNACAAGAGTRFPVKQPPAIPPWAVILSGFISFIRLCSGWHIGGFSSRLAVLLLQTASLNTQQQHCVMAANRRIYISVLTISR